MCERHTVLQSEINRMLVGRQPGDLVAVPMPTLEHVAYLMFRIETLEKRNEALVDVVRIHKAHIEDARAIARELRMGLDLMVENALVVEGTC